MVYNNKDKELKKFQRWVVMRHYEFIDWKDYIPNKSLKKNPNQLTIF